MEGVLRSKWQKSQFEVNFDEQVISDVQLVQHGVSGRCVAACLSYRLTLVINATDCPHVYRFIPSFSDSDLYMYVYCTAATGACYFLRRLVPPFAMLILLKRVYI